jgi:hypothetical protein
MKAFIKRKFLFKLLSDVVDYILTQTIGYKKSSMTKTLFGLFWQ